MADLFTVFIVFAFLEGHMVGVTQCVPFSDGKESAWKDGDLSLIPGLGKSPGEGNRLPTPVFWPGEFAELDATERLSRQKKVQNLEKSIMPVLFTLIQGT